MFVSVKISPVRFHGSEVPDLELYSRAAADTGSSWQHEARHVNQWRGVENPKINSCRRKVSKCIQTIRDGLVNKWFYQTGSHLCIHLAHSVQRNIKKKPKNLNLKSEILKLLEENGTHFKIQVC